MHFTDLNPSCSVALVLLLLVGSLATSGVNQPTGFYFFCSPRSLSLVTGQGPCQSAVRVAHGLAKWNSRRGTGPIDYFGNWQTHQDLFWGIRRLFGDVSGPIRRKMAPLQQEAQFGQVAKPTQKGVPSKEETRPNGVPRRRVLARRPRLFGWL